MLCAYVSAGALVLRPAGAVCAADDVALFTSIESDAWVNSPFNLTVDQGGQIGASILLVWAAAYGFRMLAKLIRSSDVVQDDF